MRDMHCHILPGVDDGARDLDESLAMLQAARRAGVTSIVCTPHVRDPYFDYEAMWDAFELLRANAGGFPLTMGWEVNHTKLMELGMEWAGRLCFGAPRESGAPTGGEPGAGAGGAGCAGAHAGAAGAVGAHAGAAAGAGGMRAGAAAGAGAGREFLLELPTRCQKHHFQEYERTIYELQGRGFTVIIAHPERYRAVQEDVDIARDLVRQGCKLQASADFVAGGRMGRERKPARALFEQNLYSYIASDAHRVEHYAYLAEARRSYRCRGAHARL